MSRREEYEQQTEKLLEPVVTELGFELVDVEYVKEGGTCISEHISTSPAGSLWTTAKRSAGGFRISLMRKIY